jgi:hypothetical protein
MPPSPFKFQPSSSLDPISDAITWLSMELAHPLKEEAHTENFRCCTLIRSTMGRF